MICRTIRLIIFCVLFVALIDIGIGIASAQTVSQKTQAKNYSCGKDRGGTLYCKRVAPAGKHQGQEGVYGDTVGGKPCKWRCRIDNGFEICQAGGSECDGRTPPHWR